MTDDKYVLAIDQGTTSSRAIVFNHEGRIVASGQKEHEQIFPKAGWVEHDPMEVWGNTREVVAEALAKAEINKDSLGTLTALGREINIKEVKTQVLVENGGTVVIGGILSSTVLTLFVLPLLYRLAHRLDDAMDLGVALNIHPEVSGKSNTHL